MSTIYLFFILIPIHLQTIGPVAEWLGRALQKLPQRFESARDLFQEDL